MHVELYHPRELHPTYPQPPPPAIIFFFSCNPHISTAGTSDQLYRVNISQKRLERRLHRSHRHTLLGLPLPSPPFSVTILPQRYPAANLHPRNEFIIYGVPLLLYRQAGSYSSLSSLTYRFPTGDQVPPVFLGPPPQRIPSSTTHWEWSSHGLSFSDLSSCRRGNRPGGCGGG